MPKMEKLVFATNNRHKLEEVSAMTGGTVKIVSLAEIGCHDDIPETADTFQGNALQKAAYVYEHFGLPCFADDSGLEVDCLGGIPGVLSARYAGEHGNSEANWIIYRLADVYLMKAEALAEQGRVGDAVDMVSYTYDRAHPDLEPGSLKEEYPATSSATAVLDLVFDERQREFLFEGKRYFDIVRRARREESVTALVNNYLLRKYVAMSLNQSTILSKINDINAIYMPIHQDELRLNPLLEQNPFYKTSDDISKN